MAIGGYGTVTPYGQLYYKGDAPKVTQLSLSLLIDQFSNELVNSNDNATFVPYYTSDNYEPSSVTEFPLSLVIQQFAESLYNGN